LPEEWPELVAEQPLPQVGALGRSGAQELMGGPQQWWSQEPALALNSRSR